MRERIADNGVCVELHCQPVHTLDVLTSTTFSPTSSATPRITVAFPDPRAPFTRIDICRVLLKDALDKHDDKIPRSRLAATVLNGWGIDPACQLDRI